MSMLVDYCPYFAAYGDELLELRVSLLQDHVDYFVIAESTRTHSGEPVPLEFPRAAERLALPMHKIIYVPDIVPNDEELDIQQIDIFNTYENQWRDEQHRLLSQRARVRERLQKDALIKVLDRFSDDTVFIHGDYDEIINPRENLRYIADRTREFPNRIYKIPLVLLESRADLRVHRRADHAPVPWDRSMFFATKKQLSRVTPTKIRSENFLPFEVHHITENNKIVQDLGWHFSWMGGSRTRDVKRRSYAHYQDGFTWMPKDLFESFSDPRYQEFNHTHKYQAGSLPPSGNTDQVLLPYALESLPSVILDRPHLQNFFLGDH